MIFTFILRGSTTSTDTINAAEHLKHQADQQISQRNERMEKMPLLSFFVGIVISAHITGGRCKVTEVFAEAGSNVVLPCKFDVFPSNPATVYWTNKGTVWKKTQSGLQFWGAKWSGKDAPRVRCPHYHYERGDYSLQISSVRLRDAGLFHCKVENAGGFIQQQVMLRIIQVSISPSVPLLDSQFSMSCKVTPEARGATVQWTLNNNSSIEAIETSQRETTESTVRGVASARLAGNWSCVVGYEGQVGRAYVTLTTKGIIQPPDDNSRVYAALGSAATLPCVFSPGLSPSASAWEKLNPGFLQKPATSQLPGTFSPSYPPSQPSADRSAILKEVHLEDEGTYRCSGTVEGRRLTRNLHLVVAKVDISLPANKADSVTMTCQLTDASEVTRYEWVHRDLHHGSNQSVTSTHSGQELTVDKTSGENQGEWTCRFYGKQGVLGNVTHHMTVMSGLSGQNSGPSHKTAAVVGVSFLLVALLLVLMQVYKNHRRRKRVLQYPTLETIVHRMANEREERQRSKGKK